MRASSTSVAMASSFESAVALHLMHSQELYRLIASSMLFAATDVEPNLNLIVYWFIVTFLNLMLLTVAVRVSPMSFGAN